MDDSFQSARTVPFESGAAPENAEASCSISPTPSPEAKESNKYSTMSGSFTKCQNTISNKVYVDISTVHYQLINQNWQNFLFLEKNCAY